MSHAVRACGMSRVSWEGDVVERRRNGAGVPDGVVNNGVGDLSNGVLFAFRTDVIVLLDKAADMAFRRHAPPSPPSNMAPNLSSYARSMSCGAKHCLLLCRTAVNGCWGWFPGCCIAPAHPVLTVGKSGSGGCLGRSPGLGSGGLACTEEISQLSFDSDEERGFGDKPCLEGVLWLGVKDPCVLCVRRSEPGNDVLKCMLVFIVPAPLKRVFEEL